MAKGDPPPLSARIGKSDRAYVVSYARRSGVSVSELIKMSLRAWIGSHPVDLAVNGPDMESSLVPIPQTKMQRDDTGKNEPISVLQKIDSEKRAKKPDFIGFRD